MTIKYKGYKNIILPKHDQPIRTKYWKINVVTMEAISDDYRMTEHLFVNPSTSVVVYNGKTDSGYNFDIYGDFYILTMRVRYPIADYNQIRLTKMCHNGSFTIFNDHTDPLILDRCMQEVNGYTPVTIK